MTKQEKIKEAWIAEIGENKLKSLTGKIDENGFYFKYPYDYVDTSKMEHQPQFFDGINGRTPVDTYRPKSLSGIENNHGWIKIEPDGSNLPAISDYYNVCHNGKPATRAEWLPRNFKFHSKITHYKHVEIDLDPLY